MNFYDVLLAKKLGGSGGGGGDTPTGTKQITENGTYNVSSYASAAVNVPASAVDSGTKNITENGNNQDVTGYAAVNVNVPNTYAAGDEGKVVSSGELVSQGSQNIDQNGTYDTTLKNSVTVNVSGGGGLSLDDFLNGTAPSGAVTLPTVTKLSGFTFYEHSAVTSISAPYVTRIGQNDFRNCPALETVNFPELTTAGDILTADSSVNQSTACYSFGWCTKLRNIMLPKLQKGGADMFYGINRDQPTYNTIVVLPSILYLAHRMFRTGLVKAVDAGPSCAKIWNDAFYQATVDTVILRSSTLVEAASRDAVKNIGTLYVPQALVADYATATTWSSDAATRTVNAIEGSYYETHYADGTLIPTT